MRVIHFINIYGYYDRDGFHSAYDKILQTPYRSLEVVKKDWSFDIYSVFYEDLDFDGTGVCFISKSFLKNNYREVG